MAGNGGFLETKDLSIAFGGLMAVGGVDLQIYRGEIVSLIGPNGAGKTTFLNLLTGFLNPLKGSINYKGQEMAGLPPSAIAGAGILRTFQNTSLFFNLTVFQNILTGCHCKMKSGFLGSIFKTPSFRKEERMVAEKSLEMLKTLEMEKQKNLLARNLPFGDQRKLGIGIALAGQPELLLLDEPAAGMNPDESRRLMELIQKLRRFGITVLLVEHDMKVVMGISDRIIVLNYGKKIAEGTPVEISRNEDVIRVYLGHSSLTGA